MKRFFWLLSFCIVFLVLLSGQTFAQCDGERWSVKTGTDSDASLVNLYSSTATTINELSALPTPSQLPNNSRIQPTETTTWVLNATLIKYARSYDSDYHMVFADSSGRTMIAEMPDPGCVSANSPFAAGIAHARAQFDAMFTATTTFQNANVPVQITGVGFFDAFEGQEGIAPNGIELHPIIDIIFGPTFSLSSSVSSLRIAQGGSDSATITSTLSGNFNSSISLSATGLPNGATASFSPAAIAEPGWGTSNLMISAGSTTPAGTYNVVITGVGNGQTRSVTLYLTVNTSGAATQQLLGNPGFENGSANQAPWISTAGVIDSSANEAPHTGLWKAWLNGYGSAHTDTLLQQVNVPTNANSAALSFWRHIATAETSTAKAYDTLKVQIRNSSGTVLATLATYSNLNAAPGFSQSSFDLAAYKGQAIQIYLAGTEDSSLKTSFVVDDFALSVTISSSAPADFTITSTPAALTVPAGSSGTTTINAASSGSFNSTVSLSVAGLPSGATASFSQTSITPPGSSTLKITAGASVAAGSYNLLVTGTGGGITHTATINLTVSGGGSTQQLLGNPGFENGSASTSPWIISAGVVDSSNYQMPHSGLWKAWLNGYGSAHTDTVLQQVSVPTTASIATLSFWRHIETAETTTTKANDTLKIQIRNSSGTVLNTLATYSNLNAAAGYTQTSFDLTAYKGKTIQIYLVGTENSSLKTSFVVDDFALNVTVP